MRKVLGIIILFSLVLYSCGGRGQKPADVSEAKELQMVKIMTVDPGHFHAALVQKTMYDQVSPDVYVFAPAGPDLDLHLARIASFNSRPVDPTSWNEIVYTGENFFEEMIAQKPGNVVMLAGNNLKKTDYILRSVNAGFNVLADKPMVINAEEFPKLEEAFRAAEEKGLLLYDIMTERYEVTTILQKELSHRKEVFGELTTGTEQEPAVTKESIHHFSKVVSGSPLIRPAWFFDVGQQGEGIVDVTTHLVDLVQWGCFPEVVLSKADVEIVSARRWPTIITREEFRGVTGLDNFPDYLSKDISAGNLNVFSNGEMIYRLKGVFAKVSVEWKYVAPPGGGDTHYSIMRGTDCDLVIKQTAAEKFVPTLYIENIKGNAAAGFPDRLKNALSALPYDSLTVDDLGKGRFRVNIPGKYRIGHEAHFGKVTAKYLEYLKAGKMPDWEVPGMITKYHTTTEGLRKASQK